MDAAYHYKPTAGDAEPVLVSVTGRSRLYSAWALAVLSAAMILNVADRNLLGILLVPIQKDLKVSDAAMGALTGLSFTLVYACVAVPMARLADRHDRRKIVAAAVAVWSAMTAVCGAAWNYPMLLLGRVGVAAGEASALPAMMSMLGDLFPYRNRGKALAVLMVGSGIGTALGSYLGGAISQAYGWHWAFYALAAPGLMVALLLRLTVREPQRGAHDGGDHPDPAAESWRTCLAHLVRIRSAPPLLLAGVLIQACFAIYLTWIPAYLIRVHAMTTAQASAWFGLTAAPALLGLLCGGVLSDRLVRRSASWRVLLMMGMMLMATPLFLVMMFTPDLRVSLAMMYAYAFVVGPVAALLPAVALDIARPRMRATMNSLLNFVSMVLGAGLGPLLLGALNDWGKGYYGDQSLRHTLLVQPVLLVLAALALLWTSRSTEADAAAARQPAAQEPVAG